MVNECFFKFEETCTRRGWNFNKQCKKNCRYFEDSPKSKSSIKRKELSKIYRMIVKFLKVQGFKIEIQDRDVIVYNKPPVKIMIRDLKGIDIDPKIVIRYW